MAKGLFVLGTGTDVGKTYVTGLLCKRLRELDRNPGYYKAAMSGNRRDETGTLLPGDAIQVKTMASLSQSLDTMCPYVYEAAVSPHLAAQWEGTPVDLGVVRSGFEAVCRSYDYVTMEGSGGILCPIRQEEGHTLWLEDIIRSCGLGCLLVADAGLGTINAVGLTHHYLKSKGIPLRGILFNHFLPGDPMQEDNKRMCQALTGVPVLAQVQGGDTALDLSPHALDALYEEVSL